MIWVFLAYVGFKLTLLFLRSTNTRAGEALRESEKTQAAFATRTALARLDEDGDGEAFLQSIEAIEKRLSKVSPKNHQWTTFG